MSDRSGVKLGAVAELVGIACCVSPVVLVLLGLSSVSFAISLANTPYCEYGWYSRGAAVLLAAAGVVHLLKRRRACTPEGARTQWRLLLAVLVTMVVVYAVLYSLTHLARPDRVVNRPPTSRERLADFAGREARPASAIMRRPARAKSRGKGGRPQCRYGVEQVGISQGFSERNTRSVPVSLGMTLYTLTGYRMRERWEWDTLPVPTAANRATRAAPPPAHGCPRLLAETVRRHADAVVDARIGDAQGVPGGEAHGPERHRLVPESHHRKLRLDSGVLLQDLLPAGLRAQAAGEEIWHRVALPGVERGLERKRDACGEAAARHGPSGTAPKRAKPGGG
jgi:hypothetical protein